MHGVDDLGVVDALQVDGGDAEIGVPELPLNDDQRHALARHLDGVGVPQLMRRKPPPRAGMSSHLPQCVRDAYFGTRPIS